MTTIFIIASVVLMLIAAIATFGYSYVKRIFREQKNYERGLKMVPLLIHLPPPSDDVEKGARDTRDVVDENISRAQVLYGILASTAQKGFKSKFYGQRHVALEIVASKGVIHFYTAVPYNLLSVVEQAVVSAYPTARLEEVDEHNLFSPVGRLSGTLGGEMVLKEKSVYPIATYQDIKRDTMQSLLNALSTLTKEDGASIQILLRPANEMWRKKAHKESEHKRTGKKSGPKGFEYGLWYIGQVFMALVKPPEAPDKDKSDSSKEVSSHDQSLAVAIDEKLKQSNFEVLIRVVASSNVSQRAQTIINNLVATFALFDAPGKNGFKYVPAHDVDNLVTAYILRMFPQEADHNVLNATELATLFHFPDQENIPTSKLERQASKQVDGPRNVPDEGLLLGYNLFRGAKKAIRLSQGDRARHMYVVGQTGTGKSTYLENLALQDMLDGRGFAFVDPHGDTAEKLLAMVPKERTEDVIYFSPADTDFPMGLNMFEYHTPDQKDFLIQEAINMLYKLYDPGHTGIIGPRYEHIFRNAALAIMADPEGGSFVDIPKLFRDPSFVDKKLAHVTDQNVIEFWRKEMPQSQRSNDFGEVISWFVSKFGAFMSNEMMRNIIGQTKSSFNLREIMDEGKILLVNLSRGRTGDLNSKLLGMIFVMKFEAAAMSRADMPEEYRRDFCLYVDEFQNFSTDSFADILSQARKYHLNLIVANQFTTQLSEEVRDAVFGNVGSVVCFRVGTTDAEFLAKQYAPVFDIDDLQFLPNANTAVRMMIGGVPVQPFSMATLPPLGKANKQLADALKQLSHAKYGRPRAEVEKEIFDRLKTSDKAISANSTLSGRPYGPAPTSGLSPAGSQKPATGGSFLDEWLAKRSNPTSRPPVFGQNRPTFSAGAANTATPSTAPAVTTNNSEKPTIPEPAKKEEANKTAKVEPIQAPKPETTQPTAEAQQPADASHPSPEDFKIRRNTTDDSAHQTHSVRIDKDGKITSA